MFIIVIIINIIIGIHALSCINEIMSKKFIPAEYESFLMQMFQQTFNFLNTIIKEASGQQLSGFDERSDLYKMLCC